MPNRFLNALMAAFLALNYLVLETDTPVRVVRQCDRVRGSWTCHIEVYGPVGHCISENTAEKIRDCLDKGDL